MFLLPHPKKRGNLTDQTNKEDPYIKKEFSSWKKTPKCFYEHRNSSCHKAAASYHLVVPQCANVGESMDSQLVQRRQLERKYLLELIKCLRYLSQQGSPLQGHNNNDNFTQLQSLLGKKDKNIMDHLDGKVGHKYNHHDVQNELLNIMGAQVLREKLATIHDGKFFSIMADEGTDISNLEQFSFCTRTLDDDLNVDKDFLGFYEIDNIKSVTVAKSIKDILIRFSLSLMTVEPKHTMRPVT